MTSRPEGTIARQQHLLEAAIDVVGTAGLRGLTHRAVDRGAELPEGTCSVYYRTRLALLTALTDHVAARLAADVDQLAARLPAEHDDEEAAVHATVELLVRWSRTPALVITISELALEAVRTPSLRESVQRWRDRLVAIVESIIDASGKPQAALRARVVVAALEGVLTSALNLPERSRITYLRETTALVITSLSVAESDVLATPVG